MNCWHLHLHRKLFGFVVQPLNVRNFSILLENIIDDDEPKPYHFVAYTHLHALMMLHCLQHAAFSFCEASRQYLGFIE